MVGAMEDIFRGRNQEFHFGYVKLEPSKQYLRGNVNYTVKWIDFDLKRKAW